MNINIANRLIGDGNPVFIVAELSANHLQDFDLAVKTILAMKESGADAVKFQTYTPETLTIDCDSDLFLLKQETIWDGQSLYKLYQEAYTPWEWQPRLKEIAENEGLICFSTPFDVSAVDFLEKINVPAYKIASFEITDIPLIEYTASKGKPIMISTGISTLADIEEAINACKLKKNDQIILLKCTSVYPAPFEEINLLTIPELAEIFGTIMGLSDHTFGISVPVASVALGVKLIEKHFILDRNMGGPDASFSLEPKEFEQMVKSIREVEKSLGQKSFRLTDKIKKNREFTRSLFAVKDIKKGETLTEENIRSIRPGFGLHPRYLNQLIGKKARVMISRGTPLCWALID